MADEKTPAVNSNKLVVVDLGKQKGKHVKRLRKGKGKLMDDVHAAVEELRGDGLLAAGAQTVVVVVERKADGLKMPGGMKMPGFPPMPSL
ncbi:MAG: hypothetical protein H6739_38195 [Alphaproteobacteria bacterium]|nr:hypothetical protein [Alphaproteobacteria bacterium]